MAAVAVIIATAGLIWNWVFRNYSIITANWLDDLVEYLSTDENKYKYEINGIVAGLLPKLDHVDDRCMKRFTPYSIIWAIAVMNLLLVIANIHDPYMVVVVLVGTSFISWCLYTDHYKYQYLLHEMVDQQLTFDKKAEDDEHADA